MKAAINKVERNRDVFKQELHVTMTVVVDEARLSDMTKAENAFALLELSKWPLEIHFTSLELVGSMHADDLRALQREIEAELDDRDRMAKALLEDP